MKIWPEENTSLMGQILMATPQMTDSCFMHAVILICGHDHNGAMGLVLNRLVEELSLQDLIDQLDVQPGRDHPATSIPIHFGGPIEMGRGFMLHSTDYLHEASIEITPDIALTSTIEILSLVAQGQGPDQKLLALGYAGWSAGQLEFELQSNSWLQVQSDVNLVFSPDLSEKWQNAMAKIGVDPTLLSPDFGHA